MDISVKHIKGGRSEYQRTDIYPNYLLFESAIMNKTWEERLNSKTQSGNLMLNGKIVFKYVYSSWSCKIQEVVNDIASPEWMEVSVLTIMCD